MTASSDKLLVKHHNLAIGSIHNRLLHILVLLNTIRRRMFAVLLAAIRRYFRAQIDAIRLRTMSIRLSIGRLRFGHLCKP